MATEIDPIDLTGVTCIWGGRGAGKTTFARRHILPSLSGQRIAVIDPMAVGGENHITARDFCAALARGDQQLTLTTGDPSEAIPAIYGAWMASTQKDPIYLICDEAPNYLNKDRAGLSKIMFQGRHRGFGMCLIGQRINAVTAQIRSQATRTFFLRMTDHADLETARKVLGPDKAAQLPNLTAGQWVE